MRKERGFGGIRPRRSNRHIRRPVLIVVGIAVLASLGPPGARPVAAAPAAPSIYAPTSGEAVNDAPVSIAGTASGDAVSIQVWDNGAPAGTTGISGGYWSIGLWLADGAHTVKARARDAANVWGPFSADISFTVDTVNPPAPVITVPANGQLVPFSTITVEGTAEPAAQIRVEANTGQVLNAVANGGGAWEATATFTNTTHTIVARATDAAGNVSQASAPVTFTVDTQPPAAPIIYTPGEGVFTNVNPVTISGSAAPGSTVKVFEGVTILMQVSATDGTWSGQRVFSEGVHSITARAFDAAGHASPPSPVRTFMVDATPPPAPVIFTPASGSVQPHEYVVSGSAEPHATVQLLKTIHVVATTTADGSGNWAVSQRAFSGDQQLKARARDRAGNVGPDSAVVTFAVDASPPPAPRITTRDGKIFLPTETPRIEGTAFDDIGVLAISLEYYDLLGRAYDIRTAECFLCPAAEVAWHTTYAPLPGRYVVKVYAVDRAGNRSLPSKITIIRL